MIHPYYSAVENVTNKVDKTDYCLYQKITKTIICNYNKLAAFQKRNPATF